MKDMTEQLNSAVQLFQPATLRDTVAFNFCPVSDQSFTENVCSCSASLSSPVGSTSFSGP